MTYEAMLRKINTAGTWFTGVFMGEILRKYPEIHGDTALTTAFIQQMHRDYGEALEYTYDSTKTKCYAVMSIIEGGRVIDAIDNVLQSNEKKVPEEARENANELLNAIISGKVVLPE